MREPDMGDRNRQVYMTHSLPANFGLRNLHAASVADDTPETNPLIFAAVAFPILDRTENPFAEQPVFLRLETAVVYGFGLGNLAI
jgi:hypothetical protein